MLCCLDLLLHLFAQKYGRPGCQLPTTVGHTVWGTSVGIKWKCAVGHKAKFSSSHNVNGALASDLEACAAVLLEQNNFAQFKRFNLCVKVYILSCTKSAPHPSNY